MIPQGSWTSRGAFFALLVASFSLCACEQDVVAKGPSAKIGRFFGGQVQQLQHITVSRVYPPRLGFRVEFPEKHRAVTDARDSIVSYEIVRPGPVGRRVTSKGEMRLDSGQTQLDYVLPWEGSPRLGIWNVRVMHEGRLLADRALYLTPP